MLLRLKLYRLLLKVSVYLISILAFFAGWWLWKIALGLLDRPTNYSPYGHWNQLLFGLTLWAFVSEHYRVTNFDELFRERTGARRASSACVAIACILLGALYFTRNELFPRALLVCDVLALLFLTLILHAIFRAAYRSGAHLSKPIKMLIIGADEFATSFAGRMRRLSFAPCEVAGYVRLPGQNVCVTDCRVFEFDQLKMLNPRDEFTEALIAIHPTHFAKIPEIVSALNHLCLPARAVLDLGEGIVVKDKLFQLGNVQMLDLTATPTESLDYALVKRAFDIVFSALVLALASPAMLLIAVLVKLGSPGPVLFTQARVGLSGKPFQMYKFRTMKCSSGSESDTRWTTADDPRRTPFGSFLRKSSLDELPQFINVLKGDMSVVGPRPERPHFVHKFLQEVARYNHRHALKVGITGWAQVNGWRGDTSIEKRVEYDLYYLQNWSFAFDMQIILMTVLSGLINRNAY